MQLPKLSAVAGVLAAAAASLRGGATPHAGGPRSCSSNWRTGAEGEAKLAAAEARRKRKADFRAVQTRGLVLRLRRLTRAERKRKLKGWTNLRFIGQ